QDRDRGLPHSGAVYGTMQRPLPLARTVRRAVDMRRYAIAAAVALAASAAQAQQVFKSDLGDIRVETVVSGLSYPWALAFLPDGRMLVTERPGRMRIASRDGKLSPPVEGVPKVFAQNQGGLLDVILDNDFPN